MMRAFGAEVMSVSVEMLMLDRVGLSLTSQSTPGESGRQDCFRLPRNDCGMNSGAVSSSQRSFVSLASDISPHI
jgi:hypothetical protein